jgi:hypothetical protein
VNRSHAIILSFISIIIFSACLGGRQKKFALSSLYLDYKIYGEEGNDSVTVVLQFHVGGEYGPTVGLDAPGKVMLDGQTVPVDSSSITGPMFVITKALNSFSGKHVILFVDPEAHQYRQNFEFRSFTLLSNIIDTIPRSRMILQFNGLRDLDYVRILMTDTSYDSDQINRIDTVIGNQTIISREDLLSLQNGPIQLECTREIEEPIENSPSGDGMISTSYTLRREFYLKDKPR